MEASNSSGKVALPAGVKIGAGRETSQTNDTGAIVQGVSFPITTAAGTSSSVFIPYSELSDAAKVKAIIDARVNALVAISG
jgi:hypothetical protein